MLSWMYLVQKMASPSQRAAWADSTWIVLERVVEEYCLSVCMCGYGGGGGGIQCMCMNVYEHVCMRVYMYESLHMYV